MRNRLTEVALATLSEHFAEHGRDAIDRVYREKPHVYLQVVASLLPRQVQTEKLNMLSDLSDAELDQLEHHLHSMRAKLVHELERHTGATSPEPVDVK